MKRIWTPGDDANRRTKRHPMTSKCPVCTEAGNDHVLYADKPTRRWVCEECGFSCEPGRVPAVAPRIIIA